MESRLRGDEPRTAWVQLLCEDPSAYKPSGPIRDMIRGLMGDETDALFQVVGHVVALRDEVLKPAGELPLPASDWGRIEYAWRLRYNYEHNRLRSWRPVLTVADLYRPAYVAYLVTEGFAGEMVPEDIAHYCRLHFDPTFDQSEAIPSFTQAVERLADIVRRAHEVAAV